jgi:ABC-type uncharacterized transport system substrate-binding protein
MDMRNVTTAITACLFPLRYRQYLLLSVVISIAVLSSVHTVRAHAHIFIDYTVTARFDQEQLTGFTATWTFDRMFSAFIIKQFDVDKDGKLSSNESRRVFAESFQNLKSKHYFTYLRVNGKKQPTPGITNFRAQITGDGDMVRYTFFLPVSVEADTKENSVSLFFFDPVIYVSFTVTKKDVGVTSPSHIDATVDIARVKFTNRPTVRFKKKS